MTVRSSRPIAVAGLLGWLALAAPVATAQTSVSHAAWQTILRDQGDRTTCITFAAIAALEARYKRVGLDLDLSEEFAITLEKMNWLHPVWSDIPTADRTENQLVSTGGGSGSGFLVQMEEWLRVPLDVAMPYREGPTAHVLPYVWNSPHWQSQRNVNTWNLAPDNLPRAALNQAQYYGVATQVQMTYAQSRSPSAIEAVLQAGYEVVWDFNVHPTSYAVGLLPGIWQAPTAATGAGAHSMLIIGYDRSSANPANHYFLCKNSWGTTGNPGGYTRISYGYLMNQGYAAGYITSVRSPSSWSALKFLGRRNLSFDGWRGTLDVYHLPRTYDDVWQVLHNLTMDDYRVGTFYDTAGNAFRVNGFIVGNELTFWWKPSAPNMRWDEQRDAPTLGRMYKLRVIDGEGSELAGIHWDNAGNVPNPAYGNYARTPTTMTANNGFLQPVFPASTPVSPDQWRGIWQMQVGGRSAELFVSHRDDSLLPAGIIPGFGALRSYLREDNGPWLPCFVVTELTGSRSCTVHLPSAFASGTFSALMLSWQRGVAAGNATLWAMPQAGYMVRRGTHTFGSVSSFGSGCGPFFAVPQHSVVGTPEAGQTLDFRVSSLPAGAPAWLLVGPSRTWSSGLALPADMTSEGAPGCFLRVDPMFIIPTVANASGVASVSIPFTLPTLLGVHVYSQYAVARPGYNPLGMIASAGVDVLLGGTQ